MGGICDSGDLSVCNRLSIRGYPVQKQAYTQSSQPSSAEPDLEANSDSSPEAAGTEARFAPYHSIVSGFLDSPSRFLINPA